MAKQNCKAAEQTRALRAQAEATRELAYASEAGEPRELALSAARTLEAVARKQESRDDPSAVAILAADASLAELSAARRRRSVRHGDSVYLPSWRDASVGLPNLFLRSSLFAAARPGALLDNSPIAVQGDATLTLTGPQLCDYDRKVFAACLNHYRRIKLAGGGDAQWIRTTFWQFAQELEVAYGSQVHKAIRASLMRLNAVTLRVRVRRFDLPVPRLIEAAFEDGFTGKETPDENLKGSDLIAFRVLESMAMLFGPADWSSVSDRALHDYSGLASWLASYFSTHSGPYPLTVEALYNFSGSTGPMYAFRRRLKECLSKLQEPDVPDNLRVSRFEMTKDLITVHLVRWR